MSTLTNNANEMKNSFNCISAIVVLPAENPESLNSCKPGSEQQRPMLERIRSCHYAYVQPQGVKAEGSETLHAVLNMSVPAAQSCCGYYNLPSFVFCQLANDGTVYIEYWEKQNVDAPYQYHNNCFLRKGVKVRQIDELCADGILTIASHKYKCQIPLQELEQADALFAHNAGRMNEVWASKGSKSLDVKYIIDFAMNRGGRSPFMWRKGLMRGFYKNRRCA